MEYSCYIAVENCHMWKYRQGFFTYVEPIHQSDEHYRVGADDFA